MIIKFEFSSLFKKSNKTILAFIRKSHRKPLIKNCRCFFFQPRRIICRELEWKRLAWNLLNNFVPYENKSITASSQGIVSFCDFRIFCKRRFPSFAVKDYRNLKFIRSKISSDKSPSHKMRLNLFSILIFLSHFRIFIFYENTTYY